MQVEDVRPEYALVSMPYRDSWLGDPERGLIHTGIITSLVDSVSGLAVFAGLGRFERIATLDLRMDYLRSARPPKSLYARAECYRTTASIAFVRALVWQDSAAEPCAVSLSTFMHSPLPEKPT
jgi:uncharacterized protein (TIGR00369 family)